MYRYFLELAYQGTRYSGFQIQENAITVQEKVEEAFRTFYREDVEMTGSSRTDAGVHAYQNFFHFDRSEPIDQKHLYNLNSILPHDIVIKSVRRVKPEAHARFDALSRQYEYVIYREKNPFLADRGWYLPYRLDSAPLNELASLVIGSNNFISFSKRHTQVRTYECEVFESSWQEMGSVFTYRIRANRFLRGMVRGLVGTMIRVARGGLTIEAFRALLEEGRPATADFSAPAIGLFLERVDYPAGLFLSEQE